MSLVISVAIMHTPCSEREHFVADILRQIPNATIVEDQKKNVWDTAKKAWQCHDGSHHLVLQDDVILAENFVSLVAAAIQSKPNSIISLSHRNSINIHRAQDSNCAWIKSKDAAYGQGLVMPTVLIEQFLFWEKLHISPWYKHDDGRVALFAKAKKLDVYSTVPQLVKHAKSQSLIGHNHDIDFSYGFADGVENINWDTKFIEDKVEYFDLK